jgi:hypothetical protein
MTGERGEAVVSPHTSTTAKTSPAEKGAALVTSCSCTADMAA